MVIQATMSQSLRNLLRAGNIDIVIFKERSINTQLSQSLRNLLRAGNRVPNSRG